MEVERDAGLTQAFRMVAAMEGVKDAAARRSMWRAALKYRNRDKLDAREDGFLAALQS